MQQNRNAAADEARGVPELTKLGGTVARGNSLPIENTQAVCAELTGSERCSALGMTARSTTPVLALCRLLIEAGHHPATPLEVWRGSTLCLRIRRIGEAAQLEPSPRGVGFTRHTGVRGRPPIAQTAPTFPAGHRHDGAIV
jgi:hypothetical protein